MDNIRILLVSALVFVIFLIYQAWQVDYGPKHSPAVATTPTATEGAPPPLTAGETLPTASTDLRSVLPPSGASDAEPIRVETDVLRVDISPRGGTISSVWLRNYPITPAHPEDKFRLMKPEPPNLFVADLGLVGSSPDKVPGATALFTSAAAQYRLNDGASELVVDLLWSDSTGLSVTKRYRFHRGSYLIEAEQELTNGGSAPLAVRSYAQLQRTQPDDSQSEKFIYTYTGGVYYSPEDKYQKVSFDAMQKAKLDKDVKNGWVAMIQHHFLAAWIPPAEQTRHIFTNVVDGQRFIIGLYSPPVTLEPQARHTFGERLMVGPKLQDQLAGIAPGLELTVDYGWLTVLAQPIFWLLDKIHGFVQNWGWSIIILTILIKAVFYKLSETSYRSMANMRKMTPRLQALKDKYGDDRQRLNQAMMELYKKEKINPLGGCLPIVVQIPVFIALYWVLLESVEMRQAPFALWINNLSAPDPYYVLPLVMGVSMFIQQKLNPAPVDPVQAKVMMSLPIVFTVFFAFFPAGLVLYWVVNNLLSIAQQWVITKRVEGGAK
ncbi:MAG TPA: membrane protein insertase YidC [Syntrophobacteraceae bacterium]|jgi:YidC/Oxa1 family membrane protein insertase|nr:membrane protein insertase YidC [Syntrophobacteraceae bacterium]